MRWETNKPIEDGLYIIKLKANIWPREPHTLYQVKAAIWNGETFTYLNGYFEKEISFTDIEGWCKVDIEIEE